MLYFYLTPILSLFLTFSLFEALKWTTADAPVTRLPVSLPHLFLKWHFQQLCTPGTSPPSIRFLSVWLAPCSPGFQHGEKLLNSAQISWLRLLNYSASLYHQSVIFFITCFLTVMLLNDVLFLLDIFCYRLPNVCWSDHSNHIQR